MQHPTATLHKFVNFPQRQLGHLSTRGRTPGEASNPNPSKQLLPHHELIWSGTDEGRWRQLTSPGPNLPNSAGRISCSDGWARRQTGRTRELGIPRAARALGGRGSASPRELCLWPPAPPGTRRRWRRFCARELTSPTPTKTG